MKSWVAVFCGLVLLGGCTSSPPPVVVDPASTYSSSDRSAATYVVQKGDTFWSVSKRFGVTVDELRRANPGAGTLEVGQALVLPGRAASSMPVVDDGPIPSAESSFVRPVRGHAVLKRGEDQTMIVVASRGDDVVAVKSGKVSFTGAVPGYGQVVMLRHNDDTVSFYGNTSEVLVAQGQNIRQGQVLAHVGPAGGSGRLVFKLFQHNSFVDPTLYIH